MQYQCLMPESLFSNVSRSNWSAADDADDEAKGHKKVVKCEASSVGRSSQTP
jgi:hypothetical protein